MSGEAVAPAARPSLGLGLVLAALKLCARLPFRALSALGALLGTLLWLLPTDRKRVARKNIALCFPEMPARDRARLLRRHFICFAQMALEYGYCWYAPREKVLRIMRVQGVEHLKRTDGRPVIISMPHFTGLDLAGIRLSLEVPVVSMYARQKDPALDAAFRSGRLRFDSGIIFSRQDGLRPIIKAMKRGHALYYLPDQDYGAAESVFVPFFGVPAATITALPRLAQLAHAVVLPCRPRRDADGYTIVIDPPLADFPGPDPVADARRMNEVIEGQVLAQPEQYFWVHRRFKTRPPGEPSLY